MSRCQARSEPAFGVFPEIPFPSFHAPTAKAVNRQRQPVWIVSSLRFCIFFRRTVPGGTAGADPRQSPSRIYRGPLLVPESDAKRPAYSRTKTRLTKCSDVSRASMWTSVKSPPTDAAEAVLIQGESTPPVTLSGATCSALSVLEDLNTRQRDQKSPIAKNENAEGKGTADNHRNGRPKK